MRLRYTRTALRQIEDALSYTAVRSPQGAAGMRERILAAAALVQDHPRAAQATSRPNTRRVALTPYPYVLFYRIAADGAKSDRAQLARAIAALHPGDVLMVTRLARSTRDLLNTLATITDREASSFAVWRRSRSRIAFCLAASGDTPRRRLTRCKSTTLRPC